MLVTIATGAAAARTSPSRDSDEEMRKTLLSIALGGDAFILFDDVSGVFGSESLDAALTSCFVKQRLLGQNKMATAPFRTVTAMTGNNVSFAGALARRVVVSDLDAKLEHPEDRTNFTHPDLLEWVASERPRLVAACLTVLRGYHVAGRPKHGKPRKGSFEAWDDLIRGALIWADVGDPLGGQDRIREEGDAELDGLRAGLAAWSKLVGVDTDSTASDALAHAERRYQVDPSLKADLALFARCDVPKLDAQRLGYALRKYKGRLCGGLRFKRVADPDRLTGTRWACEKG